MIYWLAMEGVPYWSALNIFSYVTAHRRRFILIAQMTLRTVIAHRLMPAVFSLAQNKTRPQIQTNDKRRQHGKNRPGGNITEYI